MRRSCWARRRNAGEIQGRSELRRREAYCAERLGGDKRRTEGGGSRQRFT